VNALTTINGGNYATIDPKIGETTPYLSINHDMPNPQANRAGASSTKKNATLSQSKGPLVKPLGLPVIYPKSKPPQPSGGVYGH
jgi:hypothetical protein